MIKLHKQSSPWTNYSSSSSPALSITATWASYEIYYKANTTSDSGRITFYMGNLIPNGDTLYIDSLSFRECETDPEYLDVDVGNLIFNSEMSCGIKVWEKPDLNAQGKFWYDEDNDLLEMYSVINPGNYYSNIELSLNLLIIDVSKKDYITCDNLDLRYGTFGVQGINTHHITIRNCDFSFIGGADQYGGNRTVRYGNGVEFSCGAHDNIVERCTFSQIYDAAITAQGMDSAGFEVYNLYFRNNVINNSEYSFEYWELYELSRAHDIYFENNTCLNAGGGWGHSQRPDPNGAHLMFYTNRAQTANVYVRNNIFFNSKDFGVRWSRQEDVSKVILDHNCWYESAGPIARVGNMFYDYATQWESYKAATKQDSNSIHGDPLLNSDLTLQAPSPCIDAGITLSTVTDDFNGTARPQGAEYDIGAFEASATLLAPPTPLAPADSTKNVSINPMLSWKKMPRAIKYSLMVSLTPNFSNVVLTDTAVVDTAKRIGPLEYKTTYFWRVCAKNNGGTGDWSSVWSFTTIVGVPSAPTLASPSNGATGISTSTLLSWNASSGAVSYRLQIDSVPLFSPAKLDTGGITGTSLTVRRLWSRMTYFWRVNATNPGGTSVWSDTWYFTTMVVSSVQQIGELIPSEYSLIRNYPNPFNPSTNIEFSLPHSGCVTLKVYNTLGEQVAELLSENRDAGKYRVQWNASNLPSGVYFYRLQAGEFMQTNKLLLLK
jgi:hypothetical protein